MEVTYYLTYSQIWQQIQSQQLQAYISIMLNFGYQLLTGCSLSIHVTTA